MRKVTSEVVRYRCKTCKGTNLRWDAWAAWNEKDQKMVLQNQFDYCHCEDCEGETTAVEENVDG